MAQKKRLLYLSIYLNDLFLDVYLAIDRWME
jgi:hypothetical protein